MTKRQNKEPACDSCTKHCTSILAKHRRSGSADFDQIRQQYTFKSGQTLPFVRNGRSGFYCIQSGYVCLSYKAVSTFRAVRISGPGHMVGYVNCVSDAYSATAIQPVTACFFDIDVFFLLQARSQELSQDIIKWLCGLIVVRDDRISALEGRSAKSKVAGTIASLARKFGRPAPQGALDIIPTIDRKTLSELTGTAIETMSRIITEMESERILARNGRGIRILSVSALRACIDE